MASMKRKRDGDAQTMDNSISSSQLVAVKLEDIVSPDFEELARISAAFRNAYRDVQNLQKLRNANIAKCITQEYTMALSRSILSYYFKMDLPFLPDDRLCPPIPNRYFFCCWLQKILDGRLPLLSSTSRIPSDNATAAATNMMPSREQDETLELNASGQIVVLDIGTGASAIYPLLWAHLNDCSNQRNDLMLFGTDVDDASVEFARKNVESNHLQNCIQIHKVAPANETSGPLRQSLEALPSITSAVDICMVNPPFYSPGESIEKPNRTSTTRSEGFYPGGEVRFVTDMLCDCLQLQFGKQRHLSHRLPRIMACMCGKKDSFVRLRHMLLQVLGRSHIQEAEFGPGQHTRWFLAWTLERPTSMDASLAKLTSASCQFTVDSITVSEAHKRLLIYFEHDVGDLDLTVETIDANEETATVTVYERLPTQAWTDDAALPHKIKQSLPTLAERIEHFLPGTHFYLKIQVVLANGSCEVSVESFAHSDWGKRTIEKLTQRMEGEVSRTNRKWRRLLKRQLQGSSSGASMEIDG